MTSMGKQKAALNVVDNRLECVEPVVVVSSDADDTGKTADIFTSQSIKASTQLNVAHLQLEFIRDCSIWWSLLAL